MLSLVLVSVAMMALIGTPRVMAQTAPVTSPSIVANGLGQASGQANSAAFQVILASQSEM
jgi:hypothetical protein